MPTIGTTGLRGCGEVGVADRHMGPPGSNQRAVIPEASNTRVTSCVAHVAYVAYVAYVTYRGAAPAQLRVRMSTLPHACPVASFSSAARTSSSGKTPVVAKKEAVR
ncbi:protein of unknown function [Paraburkholderia kururiensis]